MSSSPEKKSSTLNLDLNKILTIYGRKPVLEALQNKSLAIHALHLATTNKSSSILDTITKFANQRDIPILLKDRLELSRISKNKKQDQGVVLDIQLPRMQSLDSFLLSYNQASNQQYIALDGVTNPQNLGMIIRSVAASGIGGLFIPKKGCADIGALTIKASVGTVFNCPIIRCNTIDECLWGLKGKATICALDLQGEESFSTISANKPRIFLLGNETEGVSKSALKLADSRLRIPMANGVESLNVAVTAALLAFKVSQ